MAERVASLIERTMLVLEAFAGVETALTASDLARVTGIPMASTHRIVGELVRTGFLDRRADGSLTIGLRLWEVTASAAAAPGLGEAARPFLDDLLAVTQLPTLLSVLDRDEVVNIETLRPRGPEPPNITRPGVRLPVLVSSPGLVLAAFAERDVRERILTCAPVTRFTPATVTDRAALRNHVEEVRKVGYAAPRGWITPASTGIAVPVLGPDGTAFAAVSVTNSSAAGAPYGLVTALQTTARSIARAVARGDVVDPQLGLRKLVRRAIRSS